MPTAAGERDFRIPLEAFGDLRSGARLSALIYQSDDDRSSGELHDGLGELLGIARAVSPRTVAVVPARRGGNW